MTWGVITDISGLNGPDFEITGLQIGFLSPVDPF
jgi:hypothetical protein